MARISFVAALLLGSLCLGEGHKCGFKGVV